MHKPGVVISGRALRVRMEAILRRLGRRRRGGRVRGCGAGGMGLMILVGA
jgi:hypothetical protein